MTDDRIDQMPFLIALLLHSPRYHSNAQTDSRWGAGIVKETEVLTDRPMSDPRYTIPARAKEK